MKRLLMGFLVIVLLSSCSVARATSDPYLPQTIVAGTVQAGLIETKQVTITNTPTTPPIPTETPAPTLTSVPTYPPGYCNKTWAEISIAQIESILGQDGEESFSTTSEETFEGYTEAELIEIKAAIELKIAEAKLLIVPPCLEKAKELTVASMEVFKAIFSFDETTTESEALGLFLGLGLTIQEAEQEIENVKMCLPEGCNP